MQDTDLQRYLLRLFERHDVELEPDEEWLMTDGDFPAVRASWHEGQTDTRLSFNVSPLLFHNFGADAGGKQ